MSKIAKQLRIDNTQGQELLDACLDDVAYARRLIKEGNKAFNWQDSEFGLSALHCVVYRGIVEAIELLVSSGADPNIPNKVIKYLLLLRSLFGHHF